jgi:hypothetical protein
MIMIDWMSVLFGMARPLFDGESARRPRARTNCLRYRDGPRRCKGVTGALARLSSSWRKYGRRRQEDSFGATHVFRLRRPYFNQEETLSRFSFGAVQAAEPMTAQGEGQELSTRPRPRRGRLSPLDLICVKLN